MTDFALQHELTPYNCYYEKHCMFQEDTDFPCRSLCYITGICVGSILRGICFSWPSVPFLIVALTRWTTINCRTASISRHNKIWSNSKWSNCSRKVNAWYQINYSWVLSVFLRYFKLRIFWLFLKIFQSTKILHLKRITQISYSDKISHKSCKYPREFSGFKALAI